MAVIQPIIEKVNSRLLMATYKNVTENDTCLPYESAGFVDREVQLSGTFGGATFTIEGSNDKNNFFTLKDFLGTELSFTTVGNALIADAPRQINIGISGGSSTSVTITIANNAVGM